MTLARDEPLRFVVLHHQGIAAPHYDLMFETTPGSALRTFRLSRWPIDAEIPAEPLADHRRDYLNYQGPVSDNRGFVTRIAAGTLETGSGVVFPETGSGVVLDHLFSGDSAEIPQQSSTAPPAKTTPDPITIVKNSANKYKTSPSPETTPDPVSKITTPDPVFWLKTIDMDAQLELRKGPAGWRIRVVAR